MKKQRRTIKIIESQNEIKLQELVNLFLESLDSGSIVNISYHCVSIPTAIEGYVLYSAMIDYFIMKED